MDEEKPNYTRYRSRPKLFGKRSDGARDGLDDLRGGHPRPDQDAKRKLRDRLTFWRVLGYVALAAVGWLLISLLLFLISAQVQRQKVNDAAGSTLTDSGFPLTSPNTILVLGSDARQKGTKEPGANVGGPSRSDTILLMRVGGGHSARLSIPRDTFADIPGHGTDKINAAYAYGGPGLAVKTVEGFLGVKINHLVEVNFENFPDFIDSLGGINYTGGCVISRINGGYRNGGYTLRLKPGENHLDGKQALALARRRSSPRSSPACSAPRPSCGSRSSRGRPRRRSARTWPAPTCSGSSRRSRPEAPPPRACSRASPRATGCASQTPSSSARCDGS
jgi:LCP family protein required for cell wall assembly